MPAGRRQGSWPGTYRSGLQLTDFFDLVESRSEADGLLAVSGGSGTTGAPEYIRYREPFGKYLLTWSFTAGDRNQTLRSPKGLPLALPGARQRRPARVPRA